MLAARNELVGLADFYELVDDPFKLRSEGASHSALGHGLYDLVEFGSDRTEVIVRTHSGMQQKVIGCITFITAFAVPDIQILGGEMPKNHISIP
jgi:hypothetical protein